MNKFRIYRAIAVIFLLMMLCINFISFQPDTSGYKLRMALGMFAGILFFVCYCLLIAIFNYYKERGWKHASVIIFLVGSFLFNMLSVTHWVASSFYNFFRLLFYLPLVFAFLTIRAKEIKPLAQSFAYLTLVTGLIQILLPFLRGMVDFSRYIYFFNVVFLLPPVLIILMFNKMVTISSARHNDQLVEEPQDLLV